MTHEDTERLVILQQRITERISETGFADQMAAVRLGRHLAEIALLGEAFAKHSLPLFLALNREHSAAIAQIALSIKHDLLELGDAIVDGSGDLDSLVDYLNRAAENL
jgi:hypothetical protein